MWISIQTKHCKLSPRMREAVERHVGRALWREQRQIGSIVLTFKPSKLGGEPGYHCRMRIWSHYLGGIIVSEVGPTIRNTAQQATARVRHAIRKRHHKRLRRFRRLKHSRLAWQLGDLGLE